MGAFSIWHWIIVLIVVLILFGGKGKLSSIMGDFGKGLKNFKDQVKSNKDNDEEIEVIVRFLISLTCIVTGALKEKSRLLAVFTQ